MAPNHDAHSQNTANGQGMKHQKTASHFILKNGQSFSETTVLIVGWVIYSILGRKIHRSPSPVERSVCKLTSGILAKHDVYNSLCVHLRFTPENLHVNFNAVADYIFEDGIIVWGRVIALLGFSVKVAEYFRIQGFGDHDQVIVGLTSRFIEEKIGPWIQNRGGWVSVSFISSLSQFLWSQ